MMLEELLTMRKVAAYTEGLRKAADHYGHEPEWIHFAPLLEIGKRSRESIRSGG